MNTSMSYVPVVTMHNIMWSSEGGREGGREGMGPCPVDYVIKHVPSVLNPAPAASPALHPEA